MQGFQVSGFRVPGFQIPSLLAFIGNFPALQAQITAFMEKFHFTSGRGLTLGIHYDLHYICIVKPEACHALTNPDHR